jgi:signal transduction histidine kinase
MSEYRATSSRNARATSSESAVNLHELVRLAPRTARRVRDEIAFLQSVMQTVILDKSVSPDVREKITTIKAMAGNVAQFARQFLIITGTQDVSTTVDVRDAILHLSYLFERLLGKKIRLHVSFDDDLWPIQGDAEQIEDILFPLVMNARDAMSSGDTLCIRARNVTELAVDYVLIELSNKGIAIPKDIMDRLFEPFAIAKGCTDLAKVHHTVTSLNGHIIILSGGEGGTTFKIFLPRHS